MVVGNGRLGREIVAELMHHGAQVVVIDREETNPLPHGVRLIVGDATQDETLKVAGIERARGLAVATPSDAVTLMIRAALVATTSTAPVWVRFATDSIPAVVVLLMLPKARPTP